MKNYRISATITLNVERVISADSEDDAFEQAQSMNGDEWVDYVVNETIEDVDVELK